MGAAQVSRIFIGDFPHLKGHGKESPTVQGCAFGKVDIIKKENGKYSYVDNYIYIGEWKYIDNIYIFTCTSHCNIYIFIYLYANTLFNPSTSFAHPIPTHRTQVKLLKKLNPQDRFSPQLERRETRKVGQREEKRTREAGTKCNVRHGDLSPRRRPFVNIIACAL